MRSLRSPYLLKITTDTQHIVETERRFGDVVRDQLQVEAASVTDDEAQHLLNYRNADALRTGIASARDERVLRLRARGHSEEDSGSEGEERGIGEGGELSGHNGIARVEVSPRHKLVYGDDSRLCVWAAERLGTPDMEWPADTKTIGIESDGETVAVALFNLFLGEGCCAHIATNGARNWASRSALRALFAFPFIQVNLDRITLPIASQNITSQVLALKLGFSFEGRLRNGANGDDEIIMGMLREECPWLSRAEA